MLRDGAWWRRFHVPRTDCDRFFDDDDRAYKVTMSNGSREEWWDEDKTDLDAAWKAGWLAGCKVVEEIWWRADAQAKLKKKEDEEEWSARAEELKKLKKAEKKHKTLKKNNEAQEADEQAKLKKEEDEDEEEKKDDVLPGKKPKDKYYGWGSPVRRSAVRSARACRSEFLRVPERVSVFKKMAKSS